MLAILVSINTFSTYLAINTVASIVLLFNGMIYLNKIKKNEKCFADKHCNIRHPVKLSH